MAGQRLWFPLGLALIVAFGLSVHRARLASYGLYKDDWSFVAKAWTPAKWSQHLWDFHAQHCLPVFRTITALLCWAAGELPELPNALRLGAVMAFVVAALSTAYVAYTLLGCRYAALCAAAVFALPTVHAGVVQWYSASVASWATAFVLAALGGWARHVQTGKFRYWVGASATYGLALATWSVAPAAVLAAGGVFAGGWCWLSSSGSRRRVVRCIASGVLLTVLWLAFLHGIKEQHAVLTDFEGRSFGEAFKPFTALAYALRASVERNLLGTLGIRTQPIAPLAAVIYGLLAVAAGTRAWFRYRLSGPAVVGGMSLMIAGYGLPYAFRSQVGYWQLQAFDWYACLPQAGFALVVAAVVERWSRPRPAVLTNSMWAAAVVMAMTLLLWLAHAPLGRALAEGLKYPRQRAQLAELELIEKLCWAEGIAEADLRAVMPSYKVDGAQRFDGLTLLQFPSERRLRDPRRIRELLEHTLEYGRLPRR